MAIGLSPKHDITPLVALYLPLMALILGCGGSEVGPGPDVSSVAVAPGSGTMFAVGDTLRFTATAKDAGGQTVSATISWSATPASVASVSAAGLVTAVANGTATITASASGISGTATVTVAQAVHSIVMSAPLSTFRTLGRQTQVSAEPRDANGHTVAGVTLAWSSSDSTVVRVGATGQATAVNNGTATVRAQADTVSGTLPLTVSQLAVALAFTDQPVFGRPAGTLDSVAVTVQDSGGSRVRPATPTISLSLLANPRGATLSGTAQLAADSGRAVFATLSLDRAAVGYTMRAAATGLVSDTSQPFAVYLPFTSVAAGGRHSCGVTTDSLAYCWGLADSGSLGNTSTGNVAQPVAVSGELKFVAVTVGSFGGCGLTSAGAAYCWGANDKGQLGDGNGGTGSTSPVAVTGGHVFRSLAAGDHNTCGVTTGNVAYCWGDNWAGELGDGKTELSSDVPVAVSGGYAIQSLAAGGGTVCGVTTTGSAYCWGGNPYGTLGNGTTGGEDSVPVAVSGGLTVATVSPGGTHACGVTTTGVAYCWGSDAYSALGDGGGKTDTNTPSAVTGGLTFAAIAAGVDHTCGLTATGAAYCWGAANNGALGNGSGGADVGSPVAVIGGLTFTGISAAGHACGVTAAGAAYCWGADFEGEVGDGLPLASIEHPVLVIEPLP